MHPDLTLHTLTEGDYDDLCDFFQRNDIPKTTRDFNPFPLTDDTAKDLISPDRNDRFYLMRLDGRVVGMCMLRGWDEGYEVPSFGVLIDREWRGRGIGRFLTRFSVAEAERLDCPAIRLSVYADNEPARTIYESEGFEEVERSQVTVQGEQRERIVMKRPLSDGE